MIETTIETTFRIAMTAIENGRASSLRIIEWTGETEAEINAKYDALVSVLSDKFADDLLDADPDFPPFDEPELDYIDGVMALTGVSMF